MRLGTHVLSGAEMRALDEFAIKQIGIPAMVLMENAGASVASVLTEALEETLDHPKTQLCILCGPGNNGGDGLVAARHLRMAGFDPAVAVVGKRLEQLNGECAAQAAIWRNLDHELIVVQDAADIGRLGDRFGDSRLVFIDALFGTGLEREVLGVYGQAIDWMNNAADFIVSVDLPSGLHADDGRGLGHLVRADMTVTLAHPKRGLFIGEGPEAAGEIVIADIGIPKEIAARLKVAPVTMIDNQMIRDCFPARRKGSHKGENGHVLIVAGSAEKSGAAVLACKAAMRGGAGLVTLATPESAHKLIKPKLLEVMSVRLPENKGGGITADVWETLEASMKGKQVVAVGPGLTNDEGLRRLIIQLLKHSRVPIVLDADGINAIAADPELLKSAKAPVVLTPHPGEMARLLKSDTEHIQWERLSVAKEFTRRYGVYLVLKGAYSLVANPDGGIYINPTGNPGMATAGMGDVLTGLIAAYIAQGLKLEEALLAAVYNHGKAGDQVYLRKGDRGMIASDVVEELPSLQSSNLHATGNKLLH